MPIGFHMTIKGKKISPTAEELAQCARQHGLDDLIPGRYSPLFVFNLLNMDREFSIDTTPVIREIEHLEGKGPGLQMKPESQFSRNDHLRGLWHKHFFVIHPSSMAANIENHLRGGRMAKLVEKHLSGAEKVTEKMLSALSHAIVVESLEQRADDDELTGEWIVFAKENGLNYYLSIETHTQPDEQVAENLRVGCLPQFPFLSKYLDRGMPNLP